MGKNRKTVLYALRFIAFAGTLSAVIVMVTSKEENYFYGVELEAKYTHSPALTYFVIANSIGAVYGFLLLFLPPASMLWRFVVAVDVVVVLLLSSSFSAAMAIAYVGKEGNYYAGWLPVCDQISDFCHHVTGALTAAFVALVIYTELLCTLL
uniref:CASP-like protein n=1 Tax=Nelumbo nucifera TaxID=4432 RepID=A0A822XR66_NELNU|nr:TPA_asm: hypothetical protein HUJ06_024363 [Nelumbo nucifera]